MRGCDIASEPRRGEECPSRLSVDAIDTLTPLKKVYPLSFLPKNKREEREGTREVTVTIQTQQPLAGCLKERLQRVTVKS